MPNDTPTWDDTEDVPQFEDTEPLLPPVARSSEELAMQNFAARGGRSAGDVRPPGSGIIPEFRAPAGASLPVKVGAGILNTAGSVGNFFLSPEGVATVAAPEVLGAKLARPILKGVFTGLMARGAEEAVKKAKETGNAQDWTEAALAAAGAVGVAIPGRGLAGVEKYPDINYGKLPPPTYPTGADLPMPRGSPAWRRPAFQLPDAPKFEETKPVEPESPIERVGLQGNIPVQKLQSAFQKFVSMQEMTPEEEALVNRAAREQPELYNRLEELYPVEVPGVEPIPEGKVTTLGPSKQQLARREEVFRKLAQAISERESGKTPEKEPWQMTKAEYSKARDDARSKIVELKDAIDAETEKGNDTSTLSTQIEDLKEKYFRQKAEGNDAQHFREVLGAIAEGKITSHPDYPSLSPKLPKAPPVVTQGALPPIQPIRISTDLPKSGEGVISIPDDKQATRILPNSAGDSGNIKSGGGSAPTGGRGDIGVVQAGGPQSGQEASGRVFEQFGTSTFYTAERGVGDKKEGPSLGTYLTSEQNIASKYAGESGFVKKVEASVSNPLIIKPGELGDDFFSAKEVQQILKSAGVNFKVDLDLGDQEFWRFIDDGGTKLANAIKKAGYDSLVYPDAIGYKKFKTLLVFDKNKVRPESKSPPTAPTEAPPPVVEARPPESAISEAATANELSQLKREDVKADPRLDMPGITRKAKPNSIIVQLRDLESHPIRDIVLPMSGDVMTDAKTIEDAIRENRVGQNVSLRESLGVTTGPNGRAIHKFGMSPNGMTWTKASDWVDLIDRTKLEREGRTTNVLPSEAATVGKGKEGVRKEPWEMTDVEFMESAKRGKIHKATGTPTPGKPTEADTPISIGEREGYSPDDIAHFYAARRGAYRKGIADSQWFDAINNAREELVRDAIAEGKPVPPEVLDDYPDLQPKAPQPSTPPPPIYKSIEGAKVEVEQPEYVEGKPATYSGRKQLEFSRFFKGKQAGSDQVSVTISQRIKGGKTYDVEHTYYDTPEGQKYPSLQRVRIASDLPLKDAKEAARQWLKSVKDSDNGGKAIMETTPAPPAATGEGMPPGPGAQTAGTDVPPGAQIEQLSQAFRQITAGKTPFLQKVKEAFDLGKKRELSQNLIARTLSALKTSGDYLIQTWQGQRQLDPILRAKGELSAELETRGWRLRQAMKDMKRAVPSKAVREAISKYVDAGGDAEKLRQSAESVPAGRRAPYIRAMQLTPDEKIIAGHIRSFFDARLQEVMDAGVLSHGVEDYLHRIYPKDTTWRRGVINAVQNALLDTRTPGLAKQRVFQLDAEAERAGHLPVNDFIPRIIDYEASLSKVIASRAAVKRFTEIKMPDGRPMLDVSGIGVPIENAEGIREATLIKPSFRPGEKQLDDSGKPTKNYRLDYQSRDYPALKKWKWATNDAEGKPIFVQGDVLVHPDAVHRVDALLEPSKVKRYAAARAVLTVGSVFKQTMLDFSGFHQVQIAIHGLEHKVNPFRLVKDVDTNNPDIQGLLKGGMTLGGQHVGGIYEEGLAGRSLSRQIPGLGELMQSYHDWLFQDFIPRVKTTMAIHALERNKARFAKELASGQMKPEALYHQTAKEANAAFGEQNYIMLERSKTAQDMARLILLAPDFLESRARFALQAGTRLGGEQRMALLLGALTLYTTARIMNKAINDEWHFEPENMFSVIYNGKSYSVRTVQGDILHLMESPVRFWMHRLNPTITRPLFELMTQRDEFGRKRSFWQVLGDTISNVVPISMRNSREQSIWTSMLNAFGGSVRRDSDVGRVYQEAAKWKAKNGIRTEPGEFIYDSSKDVYRPLKLALLDGNTEGAAKEYQKLIASKAVTPSQAIRHFQSYANAPFSGSKANEQRFVQSLTKDQRHAYEGAKQEKQRVLREFLKARQLVPGSQGTIPSFVPTVQQR